MPGAGKVYAGLPPRFVKAFDNGNDIQARTDMALASMLGGMALANVKLGAVHGFAGPMGGMFPVPHGACMRCLLPAVMEINIREVNRQNQSASLLRYDELGQILTGNPDAKAEDGIDGLRKLVITLKFLHFQPMVLLLQHSQHLQKKLRMPAV
jgi:alcohol dehydrogenase class IV